MSTTKLFKEEVSNSNIWKLMLMDLELPHDTDEITVKAVCFDSESKRKESRKKTELTDPQSDFEPWFEQSKDTDSLQRHYNDVLEKNPGYKLSFKNWAKTYFKECVDI